MGAFNLKKFRDVVKTIGRPQYFLVRFPMLGDTEVVTALARETTMPSYALTTVDVPFRGLSMKIVDKPEIGTWDCSFLLDEAHTIRHMLIEWASQGYNLQTLRNLPHATYKNDSVSVSQLSTEGNVTSTVTFVGLFPSSIGEVTLSQEGGGFETCNVTFSYDYYVMNDINGDFQNTDEDITIDVTGKYTGAQVEALANLNLNLKG
jgi:hypothetical protein